MRKRILSTLLALAMCLSLLPTAALADTAEPNPNGSALAEVSYIDQSVTTTNYLDTAKDLTKKFADQSTTKIKLLGDASLLQSDLQAGEESSEGEGETQSDGQTFTISGTLVVDLNGHKLSVDAPVEVHNTLTVMDSSAGQTGVFTAPSLSVGREDGNDPDGTLTLSGGSVSSKTTLVCGAVRVSGGKLTGGLTADTNTHTNSVTVTSGSIDTLTITDETTTFAISGGRIGTLTVKGYGVSGSLTGGSFGTISTQVNGASVGDCLGGGYAFFDGSTLVNGFQTTTLTDVTVKRHTCQFDEMTGRCDCGRSKADVADKPFDAVAQLDYAQGTRYLTQDTLSWLLQNLSDIGSPFTLKLLDDVDFTSTSISSVGQVTLDLNGHKLTADSWGTTSGNLTVTDTSTAKNGVFTLNSLYVGAGAAMTLNNGTVQYVGSDDIGVHVMGTMTINGGTFNCGGEDMYVYTSGGLTVNGGKLTLTKCDGTNFIYLVNNAASQPSATALNDETPDTTHAEDAGDTMRVNGGKVYIPILVFSGTTLTVTGGEITEDENCTDLNYKGGVIVTDGSANISGGQIRRLCVRDSIGGKVALSGGSFGEVYKTGDPDTETIADLLADGYAYRQTVDGTEQVVDAYQIGLENVTVKAHTHTYAGDSSPYTCACGATAQKEPVKYIDAYGKTQYCTDYTVLGDRPNGTSLNAGWYVVKDKVTVGSDLNPNGLILFDSGGSDVHIILCDNAEMTVIGPVKAQKYEYEGSETYIPVGLSIYGQENGTGQMTVKGIGSLYVNDTNNGTKVGVAVKNLTVNGGNLEIESTYTNANTNTSTVGYGLYVTDSVSVNGGSLEAKIAADSAKIKKSYGIFVENGNMTVNKGTVMAASGDASSYTYGIYLKGLKDSSNNNYLSDGTLTVNGGTVTATSGTVQNSDTNSSIGCVRVCNLTVTGGKLYAKNGAETAKGAKTAEGAKLYDLFVQEKITVTGGEVRQTSKTDQDAVLVYNSNQTSSLTVTGGTLKLAAGSYLRAICMDPGADFGDLLTSGCGYFSSLKSPRNQLTAANISYDEMNEKRLVPLMYNSGSNAFYVDTVSDDETVAAPVPYLDETQTPQTRVFYTVLDQDFVTDAGNTALDLSNGWYVVPQDTTVTVNADVHVGNDDIGVHIILCDGAELKVNGSIIGTESTTLALYAQSNTGNKIGKLTVRDTPDPSVSNKDELKFTNAIWTLARLTVNGGVIALSAEGGNTNNSGIIAAEMIVNGGTITASGGTLTPTDENPAIGYSNYGVYVDCLTVNGGELTATSGTTSTLSDWGECESYGIYIGSSSDAARLGLTVNGGTITATGGAVSLTASGSYTYNVAPGYAPPPLTGKTCGIYLLNGDLAVKGGTVTATGGAMNVSVTCDRGFAAESDGIAFNTENIASSARITGGTVKATGGKVTLTNAVAAKDAAGSGKEYSAISTGISGKYLTVTGGAVTAQSSDTSCARTDDERSTYGAVSHGVNTSTATVKGGTINVTSGKTSITGESGDSWTYSDAFTTGTLTVSGGTLTVHSGDEATEGHRDLFANQSVEITGGTVQSDANGGAVFLGTDWFSAFSQGNGFYGLRVKGGAIKLAKGSELYSVAVSGSVTLADLLDTGCGYCRNTYTSSDGETQSAVVSDLSGSLLGKAQGDFDSATVTYYSVNTATTSNSGGSSGGSSSSGSSSTVTVPVSSDHTSVNVKATVSKGNATVEVSDKQIEKVAADGAGNVTLDVSGLKNGTETDILQRGYNKS